MGARNAAGAGPGALQWQGQELQQGQELPELKAAAQWNGAAFTRTRAMDTHTIARAAGPLEMEATALFKPKHVGTWAVTLAVSDGACASTARGLPLKHAERCPLGAACWMPSVLHR